MKFSSRWLSVLVLTASAGLLSSCFLDPNIEKGRDFKAGQTYFEKGDYSSAAIEFSNAVKLDQGYVAAHFQLAQTYFKLQQPDRAFPELLRTLDLQPENDQVRLQVANMLIASGKFSQAKEQTDLLLKRRPNDPAVHSAVSSLLAAQGNVPGAIREMQRTAELAPTQWEPHLTLALLQFRNNDPEEAEANLRKVIALDTKSVSARVFLGEYFQSSHRLGEAEQEFREAIASDAKAMEPREALARLYVAEDEPDRAEGVLKQANRDLPQNADSFLALSSIYYAKGDIDKAVAVYDAFQQAGLHDLAVEKKYIQLLMQAKHYNEARQLDNEILKATPSDVDALLYRSQMEIIRGDVGDAAQTLQGIIQETPNDSGAHYALGVAFDKQGLAERADSEWREALRLNPNAVDAERDLAGAALRRGDMAELEQAATQLIRLQPKSAEGYSLRALSYLNQNRCDEAEDDIRNAIRIAPQSAFGYVQLGNLRLWQKRYSEAAGAYQNALVRDANSTDALRGLANTYLANKQIDKAIAVVKAQIVRSPSNSGFYGFLGEVLFHSKGDLAGAEAALAKAVMLDPGNSNAVILLCEVRAVTGELDQAIATGEQSLRENPHQTSLYILMGRLHEAQSDWKKAEDSYQSALVLSPQNPVASNDLARVMLHSGGDYGIALSLAQTARRGLPDSPGVVDTIGWIYYAKGEYPLALTYLQQALDMQEKEKLPDSSDIHYHLGMLYERTQKPQLARQHFEQALKLDPNYRNASAIRQELSHLRP